MRLDNMTRIEVDIPEGISGQHQIAHYNKETTDYDWQGYRAMKNCAYDTHTVLIKDTCSMPIMQNSEAEYNEHQWLWDNATGDVLVGGLGIGMIHQKLIDNPNVTSVTIIEISQDVIDLVWEHCAKDDTFTLILDDFETWVPPEGTTFDTIWADTWLVDNPMSAKEHQEHIQNHYSDYCDNFGFWGT